MNSTEIHLLVSSEVQRFNLRKKERQKAYNYNPKTFTFSPYHTETAYRQPYDFFFGDVDLETVLGEKIPTQVFGSDLIHCRDNVCFYAVGSQIHVFQRDSPMRATYKGHSGVITDIQCVAKELFAPNQEDSDASEEGIRFATCDKNNKICIWAYFARRESFPTKEAKSKEPPSLFKTFFTMQLPKDLGFAVKTFFVSADAGKTLRMFVLLSTGQLNCYDLQSDLESNRSNSSMTTANRTIVTPCESAVRRLFVSEHYVILSTRERVSGFCPYLLQPLFDFDCKYRPREAPGVIPTEPAPRQTIHFLHVIDQTTVAIATDATLQLWNVLQQRPVLIQLIKADLSGYKIQGVTPASNSDHIHMQDKVLEGLKTDFAEMVESEAQELTRDLSAFRDLKWCFVAFPVVGGTMNNISETSNLALNSLSATPTHLPLLMFHLTYGHKGWLVDYILPFDVASAVVSFHVAPEWEKSEQGHSKYTLSAMHAQYIEKTQIVNTKQTAKVSVASDEKDEAEKEKVVEVQNDEEKAEEPKSAAIVPENQKNNDDAVTETSEKPNELVKAAEEIIEDNKSACSSPATPTEIPMELLATLIETTSQQSSQLNAVSVQLETQTKELVAVTVEVEQTMQNSLESTVTYLQKKLDQLRHRVKKYTTQTHERLHTAMDDFAKQCVEELADAVDQSFQGTLGRSDASQRNKLSKDAKRISGSLIERTLKHSHDASIRAVETEHEKMRAELSDWRESMSGSIEGIRQGIAGLQKSALGAASSFAAPVEQFSYDLAEELIDRDDFGKALTLASATGAFDALSFCFEKISQSGREKSLVFTPSNITNKAAVRILEILGNDLSDLATLDARLEWMQVLSMSEVFMVDDAQIESAKKSTVEKLQAVKGNGGLTPLQLYRVKVMINMLRSAM